MQVSYSLVYVILILLVDVDAIKTLENEIAKFKRDLKDLEHPMEQSKQFFNRMVTKADTITKELARRWIIQPANNSGQWRKRLMI